MTELAKTVPRTDRTVVESQLLGARVLLPDFYLGTLGANHLDSISLVFLAPEIADNSSMCLE